MDKECQGFWLGPDIYSGCDMNNNRHCEVCDDTGEIQVCPRCGYYPLINGKTDLNCPECGWELKDDK